MLPQLQTHEADRTVDLPTAVRAGPWPFTDTATANWASPATESATFGPFHLLPRQRLVLKGRRPVRLGGRAFDVLVALVERAGELVTKGELMARVWPDTYVEGDNLRAQVAALRRALSDGRDGARYVATVVGRGYWFVAPVARSTSERSEWQA
jgi:DNA-binding winged helix-turn-helix (wHTH) protein